MKNKQAFIEQIPTGCYCSNPNEGLCPYWTMKHNKPYQENGHCGFLNRGDWEIGFGSSLWDQRKECNVFMFSNEYEYDTNSYRYFLKKISLWRTIPKTYIFREKVDLLREGKICRCKFCAKYYLTEQESNNITCCPKCWDKKSNNSIDRMEK